MMHIHKIYKNVTNGNAPESVGGKHCSNSIKNLYPVKKSIMPFSANIFKRRKAEKNGNTIDFQLYLFLVFLTECKASPMIA